MPASAASVSNGTVAGAATHCEGGRAVNNASDRAVRRSRYTPEPCSIVQRYSTSVAEIQRTLKSAISGAISNFDFTIEIIAEISTDAVNQPYPPLLIFLLWHKQCDSETDTLVFKGYIDCPESLALCIAKLAIHDFTPVGKWEHPEITRVRS